ncbi:MAG: YbaB/EbfC family nucleoid-associated protein [Nitrospirota bacterium]
MSNNMLSNIMKKAQALQEQMAKIQEEAGARTVESSAGGGMVTVIANGRGEIVSIKIEPDVINSGDIEMLQDLIVAAVNQAIRDAQKLMSEEMAKITGGLKIPGMF